MVGKRICGHLWGLKHSTRSKMQARGVGQGTQCFVIEQEKLDVSLALNMCRAKPWTCVQQSPEHVYNKALYTIPMSVISFHVQGPMTLERFLSCPVTVCWAVQIRQPFWIFGFLTVCKESCAFSSSYLQQASAIFWWVLDSEQLSKTKI